MTTNSSFSKKSKLVTFRCPNKLHDRFIGAAGHNKTSWLLDAIKEKIERQIRGEKDLSEQDYPFEISCNLQTALKQKEVGLIVLSMKMNKASNEEIAIHLNEKGITTTGNNQWNANSLSVFYKRHLIKRKQ